MTPAQKESITGLILAGGRSSRMGGNDKALMQFRTKRMIDHVFERLAPQVGGVVINVNQNHEQYKSFGVRVVSDAIGTYAGPLAGLHAGLSVSRRPYLVSVPCDSPFFPEDMVERMFDTLQNSAAQIAVVMTGDQPHPVFALARRSVLEHLTEFLKGGGRKIDEWYDTLKVVHVEFEDEAQFGNINTPEELEAYEKGLPPPPRPQKQRFKRSAPVEAEIPAEHVAILDSLLNGTANAAAAAAAASAPASAPAAPAAVVDRRSKAAKGAPRRRTADKLETAVEALLAASTSLEAVVSCIDGYDPNALPVAKVNEVIRSFVKPAQGFEQVAIRAALGRVLAEDIVSPINVPAHDNSAMDGWALRSSDLSASAPVTLTEIGAALAGSEYTGRPGPGECVRITTGAVMPYGCDTVIPMELVKAEGKRITIPAGQEAGSNRRLAGEDLQKGKPALMAGALMRPTELGLMASLGIAEVKVRRKLRVAFFSTGDELRSVGQTLSEGQVYDSNRYTLFGMLTRMGVEIIDMGVVKDDPAALEAAFRLAASEADAVITSGGVSVGEADHTKQIMKQLGEVVFWRIAMRPGRPMAFGRIANGERSAYLFGLPGNPVAVMVTFYHFVRGALLHMMGRADLDLPLLQVKSQEAMRKKPGRTEYQRGILETKNGETTVRITGAQGSGILRSMSEANCFVVLRHEQGSVKPGDLVDVMVMDGYA
ncbi:MAG: molybdenum cofactor guanylyltransferase [Betaproteobacteria bacterium]|nr:molybdenum cofactor guanylyltransferase [Betaproteobacteria bacterium]